jgi:hypothetical protein
VCLVKCFRTAHKAENGDACVYCIDKVIEIRDLRDGVTRKAQQPVKCQGTRLCCSRRPTMRDTSGQAVYKVV